MAKSQIIKDLANGTVNTSTTLKRAKVLLQELGNKELLQWVNFELMGYPDGIELPSYRVTEGNLYGSYIKGSPAAHMKCTNISLPLGNMPADLKKQVLSISFREGAEALAQLMESRRGKETAKPIPADFYPAIAHYNDDPYMFITEAKVILNSQEMQNVLSAIESKLLDCFCYLENQFGNLYIR